MGDTVEFFLTDEQVEKLDMDEINKLLNAFPNRREMDFSNNKNIEIISILKNRKAKMNHYISEGWFNAVVPGIGIIAAGCLLFPIGMPCYFFCVGGMITLYTINELLVPEECSPIKRSCKWYFSINYKKNTFVKPSKKTMGCIKKIKKSRQDDPIDGKTDSNERANSEFKNRGLRSSKRLYNEKAEPENGDLEENKLPADDQESVQDVCKLYEKQISNLKKSHKTEIDSLNNEWEQKFIEQKNKNKQLENNISELENTIKNLKNDFDIKLKDIRKNIRKEVASEIFAELRAAGVLNRTESSSSDE
ncbi:unnamed protein product [Moneuplotes crassus]|uniref:Uncharacterized protein n=1 Tax=Euplotes crassus TaxID=5936 RepID=A0AAD1XM15_EUPCR|nr:unnamed protein product [Moneuplotes crassus]